MGINGTNPVYVEFASINSKKCNSRNYVSHTSPVLNGEKKHWTLYSRINQTAYIERQ